MIWVLLNSGHFHDESLDPSRRSPRDRGDPKNGDGSSVLSLQSPTSQRLLFWTRELMHAAVVSGLREATLLHRVSKHEQCDHERDLLRIAPTR